MNYQFGTSTPAALASLPDGAMFFRSQDGGDIFQKVRIDGNSGQIIARNQRTTATVVLEPTSPAWPVQ